MIKLFKKIKEWGLIKSDNSMPEYWDKDPYNRKQNAIKPKNLIIIFLVCVVFCMFIANYIGNVLVNCLSVLGKGSFDFDFGIKNAFILKQNSKVLVLAILGLFIYLLIKILFKIYKLYKPSLAFHHGSQRWTSPSEIKRQYKSVALKDKEYDFWPGIPVSRIGKKIYIDDSPVNNLILGMTRSGKGETLVFPMIDIYSRSKKKPSMVLTDPKLELYIASKKVLEERGYDVYLINIIDPIRSAGYNPLRIIIDYYKAGDYGTAEMLCKTFSHTIFSNVKNPSKDEFFSQTATSLLCGLIWAHIEDCIDADKVEEDIRKKECAEKGIEYIPINANEKKITLYSIVMLFIELANEVDSKGKPILDRYFNDRPAGNKAKVFFAASGIAGDKTKGSIYATAFSKIDIFCMEKNAKMLAENSINFVDVGFGEKPIAIFLGIPDIDTSNHFLATTFISQLYFAISEAAIKSNGKCSRQVHFILDEFGNMPVFSSLDSWVTVCLGLDTPHT